VLTVIFIYDIFTTTDVVRQALQRVTYYDKQCNDSREWPSHLERRRETKFIKSEKRTTKS